MKRRSGWKAGLLSAVVGLGLAAADPVRAEVIDFESLMSSGTDWTGVSSPYMEDGFVLQAGSPGNPFASWQTGSDHFAGSTALFRNEGGGTNTLERVGGGTFDLVSIDLAEALFGTGQFVSVTFVGTKPDGFANVIQSFQLDGSNTYKTTGVNGFQTFAFNSDFNNLTSVQWNHDPDYHQYDNIVVNASASAVPEPGSMALLGCGALGLVRKLRRRKQST